LLERGHLYQELGDYAGALRDFVVAREQAGRQQDRMLEHRVKLFLADWDFEVGASKQAEILLRETDEALTEQLGLEDACHRLFLFAELKLRRRETEEASRFLRIGASRFQTAGYGVMYAQLLSQALVVDAMHQLRPVDLIAREFADLRAFLDATDSGLAKSILSVRALSLNAHGVSIDPPDPEALSLTTLQPFWLVRLAYLALNAYWLRRGVAEKGRQASADYRQVQQNVLENVPDEFRSSFQSYIDDIGCS